MKLRHLDRLTERARAPATLGMPDVLDKGPTARLSGHYENDVTALPYVTFPDRLPAGLELARPPKMGKKRLFIRSAPQDRHHTRHVTSSGTCAAPWGPSIAIKSPSWSRNCCRRQPLHEVSRRLGHRSVKATVDVYGHNSHLSAPASLRAARQRR